ncbi:hypothetical protein OA501_01175 [Flavobacteriaceae bacterium]|nr:hypothetical protein [Flavobacteriaceae bacterium]
MSPNRIIVMNKFKLVRIFVFLFPLVIFSQANENDDYDFFTPLNDPSSEGQWMFVEELLDTAGYVPEKIIIYQTLPNSARVYRVILDSINSGFVFVRWNAVKKENFIANHMIEPEFYYNLNVAREIMRQQTNKATFSIDDVALQAPDQKEITPDKLTEYREIYKIKEAKKQARKRN